MLVISHARRTGLTAYQRLWLEYMGLYSKPRRAGGVIILDDVEVFHKGEHRRKAACAAKHCRPALRRAAALARGAR
jgi:hypothetical protein